MIKRITVRQLLKELKARPKKEKVNSDGTIMTIEKMIAEVEKLVAESDISGITLDSIVEVNTYVKYSVGV